jgi:DNA-binding SARP family transcriptional activator/tetratricopeptide (TPR) repeat protein
MNVVMSVEEETVSALASDVTVRLLGPLEVTLAGRPVALTTGRLRTLLAALALSAGNIVPVDRIATVLWGEDPPDNARRSVQIYVTRLRGVLGTGSIETSSAGYMLCVEPDNVDALQFVRLLNSASAAADVATERALLVEALALWQGAPFGGVQSAWLDETQSPRLVERYLTAVERRVDIDIASGQSRELVAQLGELTAQYPLRESLWARLLTVLDQSGRQAEALERYEAIRVRIADELGVDPGPELQRVYADLLLNRTPPPAGEPSPPAAPRPYVPHQLPADIDGFTGRDTALKALNDLVGLETGSPSGGRVVIAVIAGTAGIGKTALAVYWAHTVSDRFPDGQLYVNLRGFHPSGSAMSPADAIRGFLDALQTPQQQIPASMEAQVGLYRSLLAGKRMLVVLDNARDADQVRPLLPGSSGCLAVVTSRNPLPGLVAIDSAQAINLDLLTVDESRQLLARRLGPDRVAEEPDATVEIINGCARLPLALAIAAARAAIHPTFPLHALVAELRDTQGGLAALDGGDAATDVRAVFSWSYRMLSVNAARLFRLLGLHPGPDIAAPAAASLVGTSLDRIRPLLAELTRAHLISEHTPGRYAFHDLLRAYAAELARAHDSESEQRAALHRMLDHYLHTARVAALLLDPHREPITLAPCQSGVTPGAFDGRDHALAWFAAEQRVLLASTELASRSGFQTHTWQLAWALGDFLQWRGQWHDRAATQHLALQAAQRLGNIAEQARSHRGLSHAYTKLGQYDDAHVHIRHALRLFSELGDPGGEARAYMGLSLVVERQGNHIDALRHAQQALALYPPGHDIQRARTMNVVGWCHAQVGDYDTAVTFCEQALPLQRELGDRAGEGATLDSLGYAHHHLGDYRRAADRYEQALDVRRKIGHRYGEAGTLTRLGDTYHATGDIHAAHDVWRQALTIYEQLGERDADQVRKRLQQATHNRAV